MKQYVAKRLNAASSSALINANTCLIDFHSWSFIMLRLLVSINPDLHRAELNQPFINIFDT